MKLQNGTSKTNGFEMSSRPLKIAINTILIIIVIIALSIFLNNLTKNKSDKEIKEYHFNKINTETIISYNFYGMPHIYASNENDMFFAIGWAQAESRLWQMDFLRRAAYGRLSEIIGEDALSLDKFLRSLEIKKISDSSYNIYDQKTKDILQHFSDGINAYLESNKGNLPIEFALLTYKPEKWKPQDCIAIGKLMALEMSISFISDMTFGEIAQKLGFEKAKELLPSDKELLYTLDNQINPLFFQKNNNIDSILRSVENYQYTSLQFNSNLSDFVSEFQKLNFFYPQSGSNAWAVISKNTDNPNIKSAILANDPHLPLILPPIWFAMQSTCSNFNLTGFTIPGIPLFLIGRNDNIAWGITNIMLDCADFFVENIDSSGNYYLSSDSIKKKITYYLDTIYIKNKTPYIYYIRKTERSTIISDFHLLKNASFYDKSLQNKSSFFDKTALTYEWTGSHITNDVSALYKINTARNWQEFLQGRDLWGAPALNFTFASNTGDIGIAPAGLIPNRQKDCNPNFPNPGWQKNSQWNGVLPSNSFPVLFNPEKGFVANANNPLCDSLPFFVTNYWDKSSRIERITEYLANSQSLTIQDIKNLQMDVISPHSKEMMSVILPILTKYTHLMSQNEKDVLNSMKKWKFNHSANSSQASVFNVMHSFILKNTFSDELGGPLYNQYIWVESIPTRKLKEIINQEYNPWFDNVNTKEIENRDFIIFQSYRESIEYLSKIFNSKDYNNWQWGKIHTLKLKHIFAENKLIRPYFSIDPLEMSGNGTTVNMEGWSQFSQFDITMGPSARFIADMSDSLVYMILPGGENGDPTSMHFLDQLTLWKNGAYLKIIHSQSHILSDNLRIFRP
jgi:penicillin amidase